MPMFETTILKVGRVDHVSDQVFDLRDVLFGDLDAGAGGDFQVDRELSSIGLREERDAQDTDKRPGLRQTDRSAEATVRAGRVAGRGAPNAHKNQAGGRTSG